MTGALRATWGVAIALGVIAGVVYALSPLTVVCLTGMAGIVWWARRGLEGDER